LVDKKNIFWVYSLSFLFILLNIYFFIRGYYVFSLIPLVLIIVLLAFFSLDNLIFFIVFFTPLSIPLYRIIPGLSFDMFIPTEPVLFGILILFIIKLIFEKKFDKRIILHPVSIVIYLNLFWIFVTCITSTMPVVSFKFLLARVWFLVTFYFLVSQLFRNSKNIKRYIWIYVIPLIGIMTYTILRHSQHGLLNQEISNTMPCPFFNDHTSYAAAMALVLPLLIGFLFVGKYSARLKIFIFLIVVYFVFAIIVSYTRAAWISLFGTFFILILVLLKIKFRTIIIFFGVIVALFFTFRTNVIMSLEKNKQDASSNLYKQLESISNISTDASNMERLNRWHCAYRMFNEKPVFGWGPGTYMFKYAPFQLFYERTIISTNAGTGGNAHSEYIGPLAESGFLGMLSFFAIVVFVFYKGIKVYSKTNDKELKIITLTSLLGLVTYFIHGLMNNFLDTDKISALFWGFIAIIVAVDVYHSEKEEFVSNNKPEISDK
jgi:putative inorganic carbon (hco3(-)) transporter